MLWGWIVGSTALNDLMVLDVLVTLIQYLAPLSSHIAESIAEQVNNELLHGHCGRAAFQVRRCGLIQPAHRQTSQFSAGQFSVLPEIGHALYTALVGFALADAIAFKPGNGGPAASLQTTSWRFFEVGLLRLKERESI